MAISNSYVKLPEGNIPKSFRSPPRIVQFAKERAAALADVVAFWAQCVGSVAENNHLGLSENRIYSQ